MMQTLCAPCSGRSSWKTQKYKPHSLPPLSFLPDPWGSSGVGMLKISKAFTITFLWPLGCIKPSRSSHVVVQQIWLGSLSWGVSWCPPGLSVLCSLLAAPVSCTPFIPSAPTSLGRWESPPCLTSQSQHPTPNWVNSWIMLALWI